jgi:hypothetical protein
MSRAYRELSGPRLTPLSVGTGAIYLVLEWVLGRSFHIQIFHQTQVLSRLKELVIIGSESRVATLHPFRLKVSQPPQSNGVRNDYVQPRSISHPTGPF